MMARRAVWLQGGAYSELPHKISPWSPARYLAPPLAVLFSQGVTRGAVSMVSPCELAYAPAIVEALHRLMGGVSNRSLLAQVKCAVGEDVKSGGFYGPNLFNLYNDQERM